MSRWKAPRPKSSPYISLQGYKQLEIELQQLWSKRKGVVKALSEAAAEGDRSENAEYIYRKKELRGIDGRINYLQKRLPALKVVSEIPTEQNRIFFGAWVTLEKLQESGEKVHYQILGSDEFDTSHDSISIDSPLAKQLLGKTLDDEVSIQNQFGQTDYLIINICYKK